MTWKKFERPELPKLPPDIRRLALNSHAVKEMVNDFEAGKFANIQQALSSCVFALAVEVDRLSAQLASRQ